MDENVSLIPSFNLGGFNPQDTDQQHLLHDWIRQYAANMEREIKEGLEGARKLQERLRKLMEPV